MSNIKTVSITREYNPTKDLVNISEICNFGEYAVADSIDDITIINEKITGGATAAVKGSLYKPSTINGTKVCRGVGFSYSIISQQVVVYDGNHIGVMPGLVQTIAVISGVLEIDINYEPYVEPPVDVEPYSTTPPVEINVHPSETPPAATTGDGSQEKQYITEMVPETKEEWIDKQIVKGGINRKVRNTYSIDTLGEGEDLDPEEINNDIIPNNDTADRIGKLAIIRSEKNKSIKAFPAINFGLDLQALIETEASFQALEFKEEIENQIVNTYPSNSFSDSFSVEFFGRGD